MKFPSMDVSLGHLISLKTNIDEKAIKNYSLPELSKCYFTNTGNEYIDIKFFL